MATEQYLETRKYITDRITKVYPELKLYTKSPYEDSSYMVGETFSSILKILVGVNDYSYHENKILGGGFQCTLQLKQIECILLPLMAKYLNHAPELQTTIWFNNFTDSKCDEVWNSFKKYWDIDLVTNSDILDALCDHYIEVIGKHFIPFWEKYSNLQYINDEIIDKVTDNQIHHYLSGMTPFKKLIIMRICKNKDYEIFKEEILERGFNAIKEDSFRYTPYQNVLIDTIEIIESKY